jgi:hypothetical protein
MVATDLDTVPVVAIFTKFDVLFTRVYDRGKTDEENRDNALVTLRDKFEKPLKDYLNGPRGYVRFECKPIFYITGLTLDLYLVQLLMKMKVITRNKLRN